MTWDSNRCCPKPRRVKDKKCKTRVKKRSNGVCEWPGCPNDAQGEPHHIQPVGAGGPDIELNQLHLCLFCHKECQEYQKGYGKLDQFGVVALVTKQTVESVIQTVERAMGRGIKMGNGRE